MKRILLMDDFKNLLNNCDEISDEVVLVRRLLNISSQSSLSTEDLLFIEQLDEEIFKKAFDELNKVNILEMDLIKDMAITEYSKENLIYCDIYEDEEDIY